jgi:hypothetical protein
MVKKPSFIRLLLPKAMTEGVMLSSIMTIRRGSHQK